MWGGVKVFKFSHQQVKGLGNKSVAALKTLYRSVSFFIQPVEAHKTIHMYGTWGLILNAAFSKSKRDSLTRFWGTFLLSIDRYEVAALRENVPVRLILKFLYENEI
jgi:hypothetical protein